MCLFAISACKKAIDLIADVIFFTLEAKQDVQLICVHSIVDRYQDGSAKARIPTEGNISRSSLFKN